MQLGVEHAYHEFVGRVAATRQQDVKAIEGVAEGRVWIGTDAAHNGLVDHLGDLDGAIRAAAERAKLPADHYQVTWVEKDLGWKERLLRAFDSSGQGLIGRLGLSRWAAGMPLRALTAPERQLRSVEALQDPRRLYVYCGCDLR